MTFVQQFCLQNNIRFFGLVVTKQKLNSYLKHNSNFQNAARLIRYDFFVDCANKTGLTNLLVAHNKDDFLESALMQKQRKSKTLFFGIKTFSLYKNVNIFRPLIDIWKKDILEYCKANNIIFGIDETNLSTIYDRNVIRKKISKWSNVKKQKELKKFEKYNAQHQALSNKVNEIYKHWRNTFFTIKYFLTIKDDVRKYVIYKFLVDNNVETISSSKINSVNQFISSNNMHKTLRLGNNMYLSKKTSILKVII